MNAGSAPRIRLAEKTSGARQSAPSPFPVPRHPEESERCSRVVPFSSRQEAAQDVRRVV